MAGLFGLRGTRITTRPPANETRSSRLGVDHNGWRVAHWVALEAAVKGYEACGQDEDADDADGGSSPGDEGCVVVESRACSFEFCNGDCWAIPG